MREVTRSLSCRDSGNGQLSNAESDHVLIIRVRFVYTVLIYRKGGEERGRGGGGGAPRLLQTGMLSVPSIDVGLCSVDDSRVRDQSYEFVL